MSLSSSCGWGSSSASDAAPGCRCPSGSDCLSPCIATRAAMKINGTKQKQNGKQGRCQGGLTWNCSVCCAGTWPCWGPGLWRRSARTSARCSRSCCAVAGSARSETRPSSCLTCASGVPGMQTGSGDALVSDWSGGGAWMNGHLLSWSNRDKSVDAKFPDSEQCFASKRLIYLTDIFTAHGFITAL